MENQEVEIIQDEKTISEGKILAIISHFWVIGTIAAWILNLTKKNSFTAFFTRQMIGWHIISFLNGWLIYNFLGGFIKWILGIVLVVLWGYSLLCAINGNQKPMPVVGQPFQQWFKSL